MGACIGDIANRSAWTVQPQDTAGEVAEDMVARHRSWAPVVDGSQVVGVISAVDILRSQALGHPASTPVWQLCTMTACTVPAKSPLADAARRMLEARIHHLLVVGDDGALLGVVSTLDLLSRIGTPSGPPA